MNRTLQIEKGLSTEVVALMADRQEITGRFFLADHAQYHFGPENLLDILNNSGKQFVPFAQDDVTAEVMRSPACNRGTPIAAIGHQRGSMIRNAGSRQKSSSPESRWRAAPISGTCIRTGAGWPIFSITAIPFSYSTPTRDRGSSTGTS